MKGVFSSIAKGSAVISGSRYLLKGFSLITFYLIITGLSLADYGLVTLALSVSGPVLALSGFGLDDIIIARGARARGEGRWQAFFPVYGGFAITKLAVTLIIAVSLFWFRSLLGGQYRELLDQFFNPLVAWVIVVSLRTFLDGTLRMQERFSWFAANNIIEGAARLLIVTGLFIAGTISVPMILWAYVVSKLIGLISALPVLFQLTSEKAHPILMIKRYGRFMTTQGKWEVFRMLSGNLFSGIDKWVVGLFIGLEAVALLSFAMTMNSFLAFLLPFREILFPIMARLSVEPGTSSFVARRMSKYSIWLNTLLIVTAGGAAIFVVDLLASQYTAAVPLFWFLSLGQLLNAISTSHGTLMYSLGEQRYLFFVSLTGTISAFTLLPLFTWALSVYGAVLEAHVSSAVIIWLREKRMRTKHHVSTFVFKDLFVFDDFDRSVIRRLRFSVRSRLKALFAFAHKS